MSAQGLISVKHYSIEDGLSQSKIQSILQDKEGYIWLGTWNGLEKFDGYTFKTINLTPQIKLDYNIIDYRMLKWDIIILFGVKLMTIKYIYLISQPKVISMFFISPRYKAMRINKQNDPSRKWYTLGDRK